MKAKAKNNGPLVLAATPLWILEANRRALASSNTRSYRHRLIKKADYACEGKGNRASCKFLAWSTKLYAQMALRPKLAFCTSEAEGDSVLCPTYAVSYDRKHAKQRRVN